jgi:NADPH:quinone reductase-like Zn-dependent oxidoreductase
MDAAYVDRPGGMENIRSGRLPVPPVGPTDVLVAVETVTVNPVDTFVRSGRTATLFLFVIGRDLVSSVAAVALVVSTSLWVIWCERTGLGMGQAGLVRAVRGGASRPAATSGRPADARRVIRAARARFGVRTSPNCRRGQLSD